jgi:hypothetical protein
MKKTVAVLHFSLCLILTAGIIMEFFFAGIGVFQAASFETHRITGIILGAGSILLLLLSFIGRMGGKTIGFTSLLFVLLLIQPLLLQINQPYLKALHLVNAIAVAMASIYLANLSARLNIKSARLKER